jgi:hypothetical protein
VQLPPSSVVVVVLLIEVVVDAAGVDVVVTAGGLTRVLEVDVVVDAAKLVTVVDELLSVVVGTAMVIEVVVVGAAVVVERGIEVVVVKVGSDVLVVVVAGQARPRGVIDSRYVPGPVAVATSTRCRPSGSGPHSAVRSSVNAPQVTAGNPSAASTRHRAVSVDDISSTSTRRASPSSTSMEYRSLSTAGRISRVSTWPHAGSASHAARAVNT